MSADKYDKDDSIRNEQEATSLIAHSLNRERHGKRACKLVESVIMGYGMLGDFEDSEDDDDYVPFDKKQNIDKPDDDDEDAHENDHDEEGDDVDDDNDSDLSTDESDSENNDDEEDDDVDDDEDNDDNDNNNINNNDINININDIDDDDDDDEGQNNDKDKDKEIRDNKKNKSLKIDEKKIEIKSRQELAQEINVCSVCLQNISRHSEDVAECDSCGIMVHEWCYGITPGDDASSVHSNASSAIEEPWFCEPCTVGCKYPQCELCPNLGGIFKFTNQGRWLHMVCALYTKSVTFRDIERLEFPSISEIPPSEIGKRTCSLCEDERLANTGVCLKCDTGMCNTYFHITCAQKFGLLKRTDDISDSIYFHADCNIHNKDKLDIKRKRQSYLVLAAKNKLIQSRFGDGSIEESILNDRNRVKLRKQSEKFYKLFENSVDIQGTSFRTARALESSPSVVRRLCTKSEANGMIKYMNQTLEDMVDIRKKWYIPPAFSVEFVAYYLDRNERIDKYSKQSKELDKMNEKLKLDEANIRKNYDSLKTSYDLVKHKNDEIREKISRLIDNCSSDKLRSFILSMKCMRTLISQQSATGSGTNSGKRYRDKEMTIKKCGTCQKTNDQYSLAFCDTCKLYYHLACLDPPLKRMPKKNRFGGWQCSNCTEKEDEDYVSVMSTVSGLEDETSNKTMFTDHESSITEDDPKRRLRKNPKKTLPKEDEISPFSVKLTQANDASGKRKRGRKPKSNTDLIDFDVKFGNGDDEQELIKPIKKGLSETTPEILKCSPTKSKRNKSKDFDKTNENIPQVVSIFEPDVKKIKVEEISKMDFEEKRSSQVQLKAATEQHKQDISEPISLLVTPPKRSVSLADCQKCNKNVHSKQSVRCDNCENYYHFDCLDPPVSKSPKRRGYSWNCNACEKKNNRTSSNGVSGQGNSILLPVEVDTNLVKNESFHEEKKNV